MKDDVVIAGAARTPFGRFGGALRALSLPDLGSHAARAALERARVPSGDVDEIAFGVNFPGGDRSVARQIALRTGIPEDRNAYTIDRACCSSLSALRVAAAALRSGEVAVALAGGAENLSKVPYFVEDLRWGKSLGTVELVDQLVISCPHTGVPRAVQASREAREFGVDRADQDAWALRSQKRTAVAAAAGKFEPELAPIEGLDGLVAEDESPRPETTLEGLSRLHTVYGSDTITAGNAPGLSTGATSLVLLREGDASRRRIRPLATIVDTAMVSGAPQQVASIPAVAAQKVLDRVGVDLADIDLIEVNEAFAAVPLVTTLVLADGDRDRAEELRERTNVNGGAIALGHPTGATGGRLVMTLALELARRGGGLGLVAICGGIGEGEAALIRVESMETEGAA